MNDSSFFVFLDKPAGMTSHQCLAKFRRRFGFGKIGHHGTLDPFASGLLLAGVNEAVKFFRFLNDDFKTYEAVIRFGCATDTLDLTGKITQEAGVPDFGVGDFSQALHALTGRIPQTPPMYSAVKVGGRKLYELARAGVEVERASREVEIRELIVLNWQKPDLTVKATVSRGAYIRVLAEQIAQKMACPAHLKALKRTVLLGRTSTVAVNPESDEVLSPGKRFAIDDLIACAERLELTVGQYRDLYAGRIPSLSSGMVFEAGEAIPAFYLKRFIGVVSVHDDKITARRLMRCDCSARPAIRMQ